MTTRSKKYKLNWRDVAKGIIMSVLLPVFVVIQQSIDAGQLEINWKLVGMAAVGGLIAYLKIAFFEGDKKQ